MELPRYTEYMRKDASPHGAGVRAKRDIPRATPIVAIAGPTVRSPEKYTIQMGDGLHVAPDGHLWGFVNHSCDPNCVIDFSTWTLLAGQDIPEGQELSFNYLTTEWKLAAPFACGCGAAACSGWIGGFNRLQPQCRERLLPYCSPYLLSRLHELEQVILPGQRPSRFAEWKPMVYVFVPYVVGRRGLESVYYDLPAFRAELVSWFGNAGLRWRWAPITLDNYKQSVERLSYEHGPGTCLVFNLCDGDEIDTVPGPSVVRLLELLHLPFTGASSRFFDITTYKVPMKEKLARHDVPTAPFVLISDVARDLARLETVVGYPAIIKPVVSAGSRGISLKSVVHDAPSAMAQVSRLLDSDRGDYYRASGVFAEAFLDGPEFTVLLVPDLKTPGGVRAYPAVQRIFHSSLPARERFLSYDRYWSEYQEEARLPGNEPFYRCGLAPSPLQGRLCDLAVRAYLALGGTGYARVDIRMQDRTGELFVLEVNANCGISGDHESSVGEILDLTGVSIHRLVSEIMEDAFRRYVANGAVRVNQA